MSADARLLRAIADRADGPIAVVAAASRPWRSATFSGARHALAVTLGEDAAERLSRSLADAELRLPGHLVAALDVVGREPAGGGTVLRIEALTIEAG